MDETLVVRLSTNRVATWLIRNVASKLDPILFKATGGRLTSFGPPTMPMITVTTTGARTGRPRPVHLACLERDPRLERVGRKRHPPAPPHRLEDEHVAHDDVVRDGNRGEEEENEQGRE